MRILMKEKKHCRNCEYNIGKFKNRYGEDIVNQWRCKLYPSTWSRTQGEHCTDFSYNGGDDGKQLSTLQA